MKKDELPKKVIIPNPYNVPIHDQGYKNNCTAHALATMIEYELSNRFMQRVLVDVDDLWEKQKKYGTATESEGDTIEDANKIASQYGVVYRKSDGEVGIYYPIFKR